MEISHSSWPWHRSDATALAGYANMMMMMIMETKHWLQHSQTKWATNTTYRCCGIFRCWNLGPFPSIQTYLWVYMPVQATKRVCCCCNAWEINLRQADEAELLWQHGVVGQLNRLSDGFVDGTVTKVNVADVKLQIGCCHYGADAELHWMFLQKQQSV